MWRLWRLSKLKVKETLCTCDHFDTLHNSWGHCSECDCLDYRKKLIKKKTTKKDTVIAILAIIGVIAAPVLLRILFESF